MTTATAFDVAQIRKDFPILHQQVHGHPLVYLDSAASSQKPKAVIDAIVRLYTSDYSNIHRGVHSLSERSTRHYEETRVKIQRLLNAAHSREIIFVSGTTGAINLVAQTFGRQQIKSGDNIVITELEHHSNIVPWQMLCEATGAHLQVAPIDDNGDLRMHEFERRLNSRTRLVSVAHISNVLGTILPIKEIARLTHNAGARLLVDGAQAVPHLKLDVQDLDADFYAFSSHKIYGPTGIGVLYGKAALLNAMPPYQGGGDMIESVTFDKTTYNVLPYKFEAGTPDIAGVIGLAAAIDYINELGIETIGRRLRKTILLQYATHALSHEPGIRIIGTSKHKAGAISFVVDGVHPHDVGTVLDHQGIAVRTGHHCAQPLMERFGVPATTRERR